jgi:23S rRNA (cytosine1962-C5)-methyltransferase
MTIPHPVIRLQPGRSKRLRGGHPWIFSNEVEMNQAAKALPPGGIVALQDAGGEFLGMGSFIRTR